MSSQEDTNISRTVAKPALTLPTVGRVQDSNLHAATSQHQSTAFETDETGQYGDFDAGDDIIVHGDVDAGVIHSDDDRDAGVDGNGLDDNEERNFGGENTEYDDIAAPEDDDERFGEALPAEFGGKGEETSANYEGITGIGEPVDVSESKAVFPGSEDW